MGLWEWRAGRAGGRWGELGFWEAGNEELEVKPITLAGKGENWEEKRKKKRND